MSSASFSCELAASEAAGAAATGGAGAAAAGGAGAAGAAAAARIALPETGHSRCAFVFRMVALLATLS